MLLLHSSLGLGVPGTASHVVLRRSVLQRNVPLRAHAPVPPTHGVPTVAKPSSVVPSQLSSRPLPQSSTLVTGAPVTLHSVAIPPGAQRRTPVCRHTPRPAEQDTPTSNPSSTHMLLLSSIPLHSSAVAIGN